MEKEDVIVDAAPVTWIPSTEEPHVRTVLYVYYYAQWLAVFQ